MPCVFTPIGEISGVKGKCYANEVIVENYKWATEMALRLSICYDKKLFGQDILN